MVTLRRVGSIAAYDRLHYADAGVCDAQVAEALCGHVALTDDHFVAERTGGEGRVGFHEHHVDVRIGSPQEGARAVAPAKPPPITTTRGAVWARATKGVASRAAVA